MRLFPICMYPSEICLNFLYSLSQSCSESHGLHVLHVSFRKGLLMLCMLALTHMANVSFLTCVFVVPVDGLKGEKLFI